MKKFVCIILLLLISVSFSMAKESPLDPLYNMFPKMTELKGGSARWIATGVVNELYDDYVRLESTYNYFSEETEKIWDIKRDKNYSVDVELYFAKDNTAAAKLYDNMTINRKSRFERNVKFGDEGRIFVRPVSVVNLVSEYNLFFREENFIIHLHTFDGFALMDFADFFQIKINAFILDNIDMYVFKNFRLKASKAGYISEEDDLTVEADNISSIEISGRVTDEEGAPLSEAEVSVMGHEKTVSTDMDGKYSFGFSLNETGKKKEFKTNFTLINRKGEENKSKNIKMFKFNVKYPEREEIFYLKMDFGKNFGEIYIPGKKIFNKVEGILFRGNYVEFTRNCTPEGSVFQCRQTFTGVMKKAGFEGNWKGTGGKGTFVGKPLEVSSNVYNIAETEFCSVKTIQLYSDNLSDNRGYDSKKLFIDKHHGIALECDRQKEDFFTKEAVLKITKQPSDEKFLLYKYKGDKRKNGMKLTDKTYLGVAGPNDDLLDIEVYLTPDALQRLTVLAGEKSKLGNKSISFASGILYPTEQPKLSVEKFNTGKAKQYTGRVSMKLKELASDKDVVGDSGSLRRDGHKDMNLELKITGIKGKLKAVELSHKGENSYIWNTDPLDIYPAVAIFKNGNLVNNRSGKVNFPVDNNTIIDIFIHKPEYLNKSNFNMTYKVLIGDKWYSGSVLK